MSEHDFDIATPCPLRWGHGSHLSQGTDIYEDDTAALDFTTEISLPRERPRRIKRATGFKIHEDVAGRQEISGGARCQGPKKAASSMFAQPPQRFARSRTGPAADVNPPTMKDSGQPKARNTLPSTEIRHVTNTDAANISANASFSKRPRRRDPIYVPPDDTTMPSGFMGILSPLKNLGAESRGQDGLGAQSPTTNLRRSSGIPTKKSPLRPSFHQRQPARSPRDVAGQKTGKENIPPGENTPSKAGSKILKIPSAKAPMLKEAAAGAREKSTPPQGLNKEKLSSPKIDELKARPEMSVTRRPNRPSLTKGAPPKVLATTANSQRTKRTPMKVMQKSCQKSQPAKRPKSLPSTQEPAVRLPKTSQRRSSTPLANVDLRYPILSENISDPSMYEEQWLLHQEIAITQLANSILNSMSTASEIRDTGVLRRELLELYQGPYFLLLYKRVYASILHGALRAPQDVLRRGSRLKDDVGFQRRFLDFWMETFDLFALRTAAEVVTGRTISCLESQGSPPTGRLRDGSELCRREVRKFLDKFLLRNEDSDVAVRKNADVDECASGCGYHKTILRCIMMVILLDKARMAPETSMPNLLFLRSAKYKSSTAVLQELGKMLLPSADIVRSLNHQDCQLGYHQLPLQEYRYTIENLAVDLRDGVIIARLAELLLLAPNGSEADLPDSITLPTGEAIRLSSNENTCPLSTHLKIPARSRAAKLFNVQVTLSALAHFGGLSAIVNEICAADIVDGYREKTIALLWGLVGKRGLSALIDWVDVRREIKRLERKYRAQTSRQPFHGNVGSNDQDEANEAEYLLQQWAKQLALLKGLQVENLTTSFSDGRVFESIIDEYEPLIKSASNVNSQPTDRGMSLDSRLRSLGCSAQFGQFCFRFSSMENTWLTCARFSIPCEP